MAPVLLSRGLDPLLGVFTGVLAYYLYETNPRTALPEEQRLTSLVRWKYSQWRYMREAKLKELENSQEAVDWRVLVAHDERSK
ncbi:hypothetical protein PUNSTDRAFT_135981 [Punctularia strigosozonata HHB-11173 SS5]|uniref:uncharacterized protein n=1 Tax=Punctularia strigosozonata (strain HHB-11173) TaxID=741275 RepID=UPI0004417F03|nr:uncharacterized protein PUNSTDRAFT_135981 [Punctularia strigosozonata HHB-11173 SS5]EIN07295.1 hypothetical protein PUNSTDRAFT_135981 [Punctularia strigosozonata HHB-11173 SS5]